MMILSLFLASAAGTQIPLLAESLGQPSENIVMNGERATLSLACGNGSVEVRLRWPVPIAAPFLDIGVGSGNGMDASMKPAERWKTLVLPDRRTAVAPMPAADIVAVIADDELLLLNVGNMSNSTTAEFDARLFKATVNEMTDRCAKDSPTARSLAVPRQP